MKYLFLFTCLFFAKITYGEGSKDLYPSGVKGVRAYLSAGDAFIEQNNFMEGVHFVWVRRGETIAVASSAQNIGNGKIVVYSPSGRQYTSQQDNVGRIMAKNGYNTREAELAGPRKGYTPYEIAVDEEGIWEVRFVAPIRSLTEESPPVKANDAWTQGVISHIAA